MSWLRRPHALRKQVTCCCAIGLFSELGTGRETYRICGKLHLAMDIWGLVDAPPARTETCLESSLPLITGLTTSHALRKQVTCCCAIGLFSELGTGLETYRICGKLHLAMDIWGLVDAPPARTETCLESSLPLITGLTTPHALRKQVTCCCAMGLFSELGTGRVTYRICGKLYLAMDIWGLVDAPQARTETCLESSNHRSNYVVRGWFPRVVQKACSQERTCRKHRQGWVFSTSGNAGPF